MSSSAPLRPAWLPRGIRWSNSRQSWGERAGAAVLVAVAAVGAWSGPRLPLAYQVVFWTAWSIAVAVLARRGWLRLFGPVLFYDLVRTSRRTRYIVLRCLYIAFLLALLLWVYSLWFLENRQRSPAGYLPSRDTAAFAESFFFTLMVVQFVVVVLLTPAYLGGAIAEEKERKTLEYLLATDLAGREIVLGKLAARLLNLAMIVLAALPVLSATEFFGGVDPDLVLAAFATLGLTMLGLSAVCMLVSVHARRARDAIVLGYLFLVLYPALGLTSLWLVTAYPGLNFAPVVPLPWSDEPVTLGDVVRMANAGNLPYVLFKVGRTIDSGQVLADTLPGLLRDYALFHGLLALGCCTWAVSRLRPVALREASGRTRRVPLGVRLLGRPRVSSQQPMFWKEIFAEPRLRLGWLGRIAVAALVFLSFLPLWFIAENTSAWRRLNEEVNIWLRLAGTSVLCLILLAVAVRAAGSVRGEHDRQTLDALLTSPLSNGNILLAKWLGSVLSVRMAWIWLGAIWAVGFVTGGLFIPAALLVLVAWFVYAGAFAVVGLWYSVACRTTVRATVWTLLTVLLIGGGHWLIAGFCCFLPLSLVGTSGRDFEFVPKFLAGQTPPFVLGLFAASSAEIERGSHGTRSIELVIFALFGLASWAGGTLVLAALVKERFAAVTGRESRQQPRRAGPPDGTGTGPPVPFAGAPVVAHDSDAHAG